MRWELVIWVSVGRVVSPVGSRSSMVHSVHGKRVVHHGYMMQSIQGMVMHEVGLMVWHGGIGMMVESDCNHMLGFIGWRVHLSFYGVLVCECLSFSCTVVIVGL